MAASSAPQSSVPASRKKVEHELELLESAITLVAGANASRVIVVLPDDDLILAAVRASARLRGVLVRSAPRSRGGCDVVVEPIG